MGAADANSQQLSGMTVKCTKASVDLHRLRWAKREITIRKADRNLIRSVRRHTYLNPCSRVHLEKQIYSHFVKKCIFLYRTKKCRTVFVSSMLSVHVLSQINPVHAGPSYFFNIYFNIIFQLTPRSSGFPNYAL